MGGVATQQGQAGAARVSYAQNFEDIMLDRAFAGRDTGFYIDVGAFHPDIDSVTRHFYDAGWRGINIEPVAAQHALLAGARARDINLNVALGRESGELILYDFSPLGVSTLDPAIAEEMRARGMVGREVKVPVRTLAEICRQYEVREVDFLKVDVEGHESEVLSGHDWDFVRPRILLIEATRPMSPTPSFAAWEPMILGLGYHFAWFDGLNRFYVRREDADLLTHFKAPPNVFDGFALTAGGSDGLALARKASGRQLLVALAARVKRRLLRR
jgi:FkbM family methyltransferase